MMSYLKKTKSHYILFFILSGLIFFTSCKEEDETDVRDSYVGTYSGVLTFTNSGTNYSEDVTVKISKSDIPGTIVIESVFYKTGINEYASAYVSNGSFNTAFMSFLNGFTETVTIFNGRLNNRTISYSFSAQDFVTCTVSATKL